MVSINYFAVLVAALIPMIIGALWYSPILFAKQWMKLIGKTEADIKKGNPTKGYIGSFLGALVMSYVLAHIVVLTNSTSISGGLQAGFWAWLGFVATTHLSMYLFENKPLKLYAINVGYYLVALPLMGALLASWL